MSYVLAPMLTGEEVSREDLFGTKSIPKMSFPFERRIQDSQGNTPRCTVYSFAEILENKIFWETGEWWKLEDKEIGMIWDIMVAGGLADEQYGAYINAPLIAMQNKEIVLHNTEKNKDLKIEIENWFTVGNKLDGNLINEIKTEIVFGGGVLTGINNRLSKLDYYKAKEEPYIVERGEEPHSIAHAINLSGYDDTGERIPSGLISSSGSWGDKFGDSGVVYFRVDDIHTLFQPIGFNINIL